MKASELIEKLNTLIAEHGDLEVRPRDTEFMWDTFEIDHVVIAPDKFYGVGLIDSSTGPFILISWEE